MTPVEIGEIAKELHHLNAQESFSPIGWLGLLIAGAGVWVAYSQLKKLRLQVSQANISIKNSNQKYQDSHDLIRRQNSIEIVQYYLQNSRPEHNKMKDFLEKLDEKDIKKLFEGDKIKIKREQAIFAFSSLRKEFPDIQERYKDCNEDCDFTHAESMHLRFIMLDILNLIEASLMPWHLGVADEDIIIEQLSPLVAVRDGKRRLNDARRMVGVEKFPATAAFIEKLDDLQNKSIVRNQLGINV